MGNMTPSQLEARKKWILGNKKMKRNPSSNAAIAFTHLRGYHLGDIRCCSCMKWINPNNWEEAREIEVTASGRRVHALKYCDRGLSTRGGPKFTTQPRYSPARKRRLEKVARY